MQVHPAALENDAVARRIELLEFREPLPALIHQRAKRRRILGAHLGQSPADVLEGRPIGRGVLVLEAEQFLVAGRAGGPGGRRRVPLGTARAGQAHDGDEEQIR